MRFRAPWQWNGGPAVLQSRATDDTGMVQPTRAQFCRGARLARRLSLQRDRKLAHRREGGGEQCLCLSALAVCAALVVIAPPALAQAPQFGQPIAPADIAPWDISIGPDGAGLPPGRGTAAQGEAVYAAKCQACHGEKGAGRPNDALVGGMARSRPASRR